MLFLSLSLAIAGSYLFSIYFHQPESLRQLKRNDPAVIKYRLKRVSALCLMLVCVVPWILSTFSNATYAQVFDSFGIVPRKGDLGKILYNVACVLLLYIGPIVNYLYNDVGTYGAAVIGEDFANNYMKLEGFRNHVFAPITEELIYRAMVIQTLKHGPNPPSERFIQYVTPLYFGIAHLHHAFELRRRGIQMSVVVFNVFFQTTYTTVFGLLATYLYEKSGSLWCPVVVHGVCNLMSFPDLVVQGSVLYQVAYYILLVVGLVGYLKMIGSM